MSKSVQFIRFANKMAHFDADVEMVSMLVDSYSLWREGGNELFPGSSDGTKYPVLSKRIVSERNREIAIRHLANTVYSSYIKDLSEELHIYLRLVVKEAWQSAKVDPGRLAGFQSSSTMTYREILEHLQRGSLADEVVDRIFQGLEALRSDKDLIKEIQKKLGIEVSSDAVSAAVSILDVRHKLVHADGFVSTEWKNNHPTLQYKVDSQGRIEITLNYSTVINARKAITNLIECIDKEVLKKGLVVENTPCE